MGITQTMKTRALDFSQKAMERIFADEKRAERVVAVIGRAQQAKKSLDSTQRALMNQFNFATRQDFKDLGRTLASLQKRLKAMSEKIETLSR